MTEVPAERVRPAKDSSAMTARLRSAGGRTTLASTGRVVGFDGTRRAQQGCCSPHGMAGESFARNRIGVIRG